MGPEKSKTYVVCYIPFKVEEHMIISISWGVTMGYWTGSKLELAIVCPVFICDFKRK